MLGLLGSGVGTARFALLAWMLALVFRGAPSGVLVAPAFAVAGAVLLRGRLYDKIAALGPAWFVGERTGGVALSVHQGDPPSHPVPPNERTELRIDQLIRDKCLRKTSIPRQPISRSAPRDFDCLFCLGSVP